jgi:hypothetical protein
VGELRYLVEHALGRTSCSLCAVTHGRLRPKRAWLDAAGRLPAPMRLVHRDERSAAEVAASGDRLPCVLVRRGLDVEVLLGPEELTACGGDVPRFTAAVADALN